MLYITDENDYGHHEIVETFDTIDDARDAVELMKRHLDDDHSIRLRWAIAQLEDQISDYLKIV